jgi:hypothetical protein
MTTNALKHQHSRTISCTKRNEQYDSDNVLGIVAGIATKTTANKGNSYQNIGMFSE